MNPEFNTHRLFIAAPVTEPVLQISNELRLKNEHLKGTKWVPLKNLHLTLFFLGETDAVHIPHILDVMESELDRTPPFTLQSDAVVPEGARPGHPSMIWARFCKNPQFSALVNAFGTHFSPVLKSPVKFKDPVPHVTLARIRSGPLPDISVSFRCSIEISGFELWESRKITGGVEYSVIGKRYHSK